MLYFQIINGVHISLSMSSVLVYMLVFHKTKVKVLKLGLYFLHELQRDHSATYNISLHI
jgi:hypothetical protein